MEFIKDDVVKQHASELRTDASELRAAAAEAEAKASKFEAMVEAGLLRRRELRQRMTNTPARLPASKEAGVKASSHKAAGVQVSSHKAGVTVSVTSAVAVQTDTDEDDVEATTSFIVVEDLP